MEDTLKRLLEAEARAEAIVDEAEHRRDALIDSAMSEAKREEARFEARVPEIHASFVNKAEARAVQAVGELEFRYNERTEFLRKQAEERHDEALESALRYLLDPSVG